VEPAGFRRSMSEQPAVLDASGEGRTFYGTADFVSQYFQAMHWPSSLALAAEWTAAKSAIAIRPKPRLTSYDP